MRHHLLLAILLLLNSGIFSQSKLAVSITPAIVCSPAYAIGIQPGVQYRFNERIYLHTDITFLPYRPQSYRISDLTYFRIKPEVQFNFQNSRRFVRRYWGIQLSYAYRSFKDENGGLYYPGKRTDSVAIHYDEARINSPVGTATIQYGFEARISDRISSEFFMGMGVRGIFTKHHQVINPVPGRGPGFLSMVFPDGFYSTMFNSTIWAFHCNAGIRLVVRLGKIEHKDDFSIPME